MGRADPIEILLVALDPQHRVVVALAGARGDDDADDAEQKPEHDIATDGTVLLLADEAADCGAGDPDEDDDSIHGVYPPDPFPKHDTTVSLPVSVDTTLPSTESWHDKLAPVVVRSLTVAVRTNDEKSPLIVTVFVHGSLCLFSVTCESFPEPSDW